MLHLRVDRALVLRAYFRPRRWWRPRVSRDYDLLGLRYIYMVRGGPFAVQVYEWSPVGIAQN